MTDIYLTRLSFWRSHGCVSRSSSIVYGRETPQTRLMCRLQLKPQVTKPKENKQHSNLSEEALSCKLCPPFFSLKTNSVLKSFEENKLLHTNHVTTTLKHQESTSYPHQNKFTVPFRRAFSKQEFGQSHGGHELVARP